MDGDMGRLRELQLRPGSASIGPAPELRRIADRCATRQFCAASNPSSELPTGFKEAEDSSDSAAILSIYLKAG